MLGKLKTISWFLKRPEYFPHLFYITKTRLLGKFDTGNERPEATAWCKARAISTGDALKKITGSSGLKTLYDLFPAEMKNAHAIASTIPDMGGGGNLDLIYHLCEFVKAEKVIETGVGYGWSSLAILLSLKNRPSSKLISIDMPYIQYDYDKFVGSVVPAELKNNWTLKQCSDRMGLDVSIKELGSIDLCHYDSDKNYVGRMWAYPRLWNALRKGGIFISDDISDNMGFRDFCVQIKAEPIIIELTAGGVTKYIGVVVK